MATADRAVVRKQIFDQLEKRKKKLWDQYLIDRSHNTWLQYKEVKNAHDYCKEKLYHAEAISTR